LREYNRIQNLELRSQNQYEQSPLQANEWQFKSLTFTGKSARFTMQPEFILNSELWYWNYCGWFSRQIRKITTL